MQYAITLPGSDSDTERFAHLLNCEDPSAVLDHAPDALSLRLSTCRSKHELQSLAGEAGMAVDAQPRSAPDQRASVTQPSSP